MKKQTMGGTLTWRSFLKTSAAATAALAAGEAKAGVAQEAPLKDPMVYAGERLRNVAMPMGGIGTGQVALCGDGTLRQWQIFNNVNHLAFLPGTHFLFYYRQRRIRSGVRFLQSAEFYQTPYQPVPFVTDHVIPEYSRQVLKSYRGADRITYIGQYPIAHLEYHFDDLPLRVIMESFNPMIPLDMKDSSIPIVLFKFSFTNTDEVPTTIDLWLTLQNGVGYDGKSTIEGTHNPGYGGNQNQVVRLPGLTGVNMMSTALEASHLHNGTMMVVLFDQDAGTLCQWQDLDQLVTAHVQQRSYGKRNASDTSPRGETYNGAVVKPMLLPPGQSRQVTAAIAWSFPNQVNQWGQPGRRVNDTNTKFYVGHQYNNWFPNAMSAVLYTQQNLKRLESQTRTYHHSFFDSTLPREVLSRVSSQSSIMRSPSIFTDEKGEFFGFEGCHFAQPDWWGGTTGGCCPLNCTHVWQYAQTIAALYPSLYTDCGPGEASQGQLGQRVFVRSPHRTVVGLYAGFGRYPPTRPRPSVG
ncbi:hypothetical protein MYX78_03245 [Acidobacteria bacterium AH-259-G07]|nr:hypothetical protein [Acidobacteria bacterium AH-259-G07]